MYKIIISILSIVVLSYPIPLLAKRVIIDYPDTITVDGIVYKPAYSESIFLHKVYVEAFDSKDNKVIWKRKLYSTFLNPFIEHDAQFIMIKKIQLKNDTLVIENEKNISYFINLK